MMVINQMNNILSTFLMINIWFLILLVLEIQQSKGFDKKGLWKFNRGYIKNNFVNIKPERGFKDQINKAKQYIWKERI